MSLNDLLFIAITLWLILISMIILVNMKDKERGKKMDTITKAKIDMQQLEQITKNLEENHKPINISLTNYEQEQENNAIISYDELIKNKNNFSVNYDESYIPKDKSVDVKKVDLNDYSPKEPTHESNIKVTLMSYEKEEAFLKALKQLQMDLAR